MSWHIDISWQALVLYVHVEWWDVCMCVGGEGVLPGSLVPRTKLGTRLEEEAWLWLWVHCICLLVLSCVIFCDGFRQLFYLSAFYLLSGMQAQDGWHWRTSLRKTYWLPVLSAPSLKHKWLCQWVYNAWSCHCWMPISCPFLVAKCHFRQMLHGNCYKRALVFENKPTSWLENSYCTG